MYIQTLKNFIIKDNLGEFFKVATSLQIRDQFWQNQLLLINSRYENIQHLNRIGNLAHGDYTLELNRIKLSCLELLQALEDSPSTPQMSLTSSAVHSKLYSWLWWSLPIALLLTYLGINQFKYRETQNPDTNQNQRIDSPHVKDKILDINNSPIPVIPKQAKASLTGSKLVVTSNEAKYYDLAYKQIEETLLNKKIGLKSQDYANTIQCEVNIKSEESKSPTGEPSTILNATLYLQIIQEDGSKCFSKLIQARNAQMPPSEADEQRAVENLLFDLLNQLKDVLPGGCNDL